MRKSYSLKCPTCGVNYFSKVKWIECYGCSYDRNVLGIVTKPLPSGK